MTESSEKFKDAAADILTAPVKAAVMGKELIEKIGKTEAGFTVIDAFARAGAVIGETVKNVSESETVQKINDWVKKTGDSVSTAAQKAQETINDAASKASENDTVNKAKEAMRDFMDKADDFTADIKQRADQKMAEEIKGAVVDPDGTVKAPDENEEIIETEAIVQASEEQ